MDPGLVLHHLGGTASAARLRVHCARRAIAAAVRQGRIIRTGRGRYALPGLGEAWRHADRLHAVLSGPSAAQFWGLDLRLVPGQVVQPTLTVPRNRNVSPARREGVVLKWRTLGADEVVSGPVPEWDRQAPGRVTSIFRTVFDCCRDLTEIEALCVVDSALRIGLRREHLLTKADSLPRSVRSRVRRVIEQGDGRAANPFETCLRHIVAPVSGLEVVPQLQIGPHFVDLADPRLGIVIEAESFAFHGSKEMFRSDTRRYTWLVTQGWMVVRFVWEDVMFRPERVRAQVERAVALRRTEQRATRAG